MRLRERVGGSSVTVKAVFLLLLGAVAGALALIGFDKTLHYSSTNEFCAYCHAGNVMKEWQVSVHHTNPSGMIVNCSDCHIPKEFLPKMKVKIMALSDVWAYFQGTIDTPEKFEAKRLEMAKTVWARMAARQDKECRTCHVTEAMNNIVNKKLHLAADKDGQPCSDCHEGVAHNPPIHPEEEEEVE